MISGMVVRCVQDGILARYGGYCRTRYAAERAVAVSAALHRVWCLEQVGGIVL